MSLTSPVKPAVSTFLIDPGLTYTIVNPVDEYIYATDVGVASLTLPVAKTIYAGFRIRISNLQTIGNSVLVAPQGPDTLTGTGIIDAGFLSVFLTDGISKWYLI